MKFSILLTKVMMIVLFGIQAQAQSENYCAAPSDTPPSPPTVKKIDTIQLTPYPISSQDRELLFALIKADNIEEIKIYLVVHDSFKTLPQLRSIFKGLDQFP